MITVVREMAHRVATELAHMEKQRLTQDATDAEQDALLAEVLDRALEAAEASVERSPDLLPLLREHGVVDAGGYGVTLLIAGLIAGLRGEQRRVDEVPHHAPAQFLHDVQHESSRYRYCTNFVVTGEGMGACLPGAEAGGAGRLGAGGGGRAHAARARAHRRAGERRRAVQRSGAPSSGSTSPTCTSRRTSAPRGFATTAALAARQQVRCGVVAVAAGRRHASSSTSSSAHTWSRAGRPSTRARSRSLPESTQVAADQVIVLPNSPNVIMAAERAAELSEKTVAVVEIALAPGRPRLSRGARSRRPRRAERAAAAGGARRRSIGVGRARRSGRQEGPLPGGRGGRVRRGGDRRVGRAGSDTVAGSCERLGGGARAGDGAARARGRRSAGRRARAPGTAPVSSSRPTKVASPTTGG